MSNAYTILAKYYDGFISRDCESCNSPQSFDCPPFQDCDYVCWSQYLLSKAKKHGVSTAVDIACGTGIMTKFLADAGISVTATDVSRDMLNAAAGKCKATFALQDMRKLQILGKADMAVCVNDGVNYLKPAELVPFFTRVSNSLKSGAPFVFDVSSEYKLTQVIGGNVFYYDFDDVTLLWTNNMSGGRVKMDITVFEKQNNGLYLRFDESHVQYVHRQADVERALTESGFEVAEVTADYGNALKPDSHRITFYAVKNK